jgi:glycosyltransferase involved in cell wall biosynthesis
MRVNVLGATLNFGYHLTRWMREYGVDARCYAFDNQFARDRIEWEANRDKAIDSWYHFKPSQPIRRPLYPYPKLLRELGACDVLLTTGGYEPILAHRTGKPHAIWSLGGELESLPFATASMHARACAFVQKRAICSANSVIYSMVFQRESSIQKLGLTRTRFLPIPMGPQLYQQMPLAQALAMTPPLFRDADLVVFAPARHQIDPRRYHYKGNEQLVRGFAEFRRAWTGRARLVMVQNGEFEVTQRLVNSLGLEDSISIEPMYNRETLRAIYSMPNVVVADQFNREAGFGFAGLETLFHSQVLITSWDIARHADVYAEPAPILGARNATEITARLDEAVKLGVEGRKQLGHRAREWVVRYHRYDVIIPQLVAILRGILDV